MTKRWTDADVTRYQSRASGREPETKAPSEHAEQVAFISWCRTDGASEWPELKLLFAIPNGGHRHKVTAAKMKAEGCVAGVPDLFAPIARRDSHGLFIEMKRTDRKPKRDGKGGVSSEQQTFIEALRDQAYTVAVCYGCDDAKRAVRKYLGGT